MIADRYYYSELSDREKAAYMLLYDGVKNLQKEIIFRGLFLSDREKKRIVHAVASDNPFLYYFNQTYLPVKESILETVLTPQYFCTKEDVKAYNKKIENVVNRMMVKLQLSGASESEKVQRVHDYFCKNIQYDFDSLNDNSTRSLFLSHSIIGVFAKHKGVCEGIAKAFKLILNTAGVKCIVVSGLGGLDGGSHSWNIVKIDGKCYHIDLTWDLTNSAPRLINYDYYNLTDDDILRDHSDFHDVPVCISRDENYFIKNNLDFQNRETLYRNIEKDFVKGKRDFYFRYRGNEDMESLMTDISQFLANELRKYHQNGRISSSMQESQGTGRLTIK